MASRQLCEDSCCEAICDAEGVAADLRGLVVGGGHPDAVLVIDEIGFLKKSPAGRTGWRGPNSAAAERAAPMLATCSHTWAAS